MERYNNIVKIEKIKKCLEQGETTTALKVAETVNRKKIKNMSDLSILAEAYFQNRHYEVAKEIFLSVYSKTKTRRILAQIVHLSIKLNDANDAQMYLDEFIKIAPRDFYRHIFRYSIDKMLGKEIEVLIEDLEKLKEAEYMESWAYELAKLYHKAGEKDKCIEECSNIVLWFGSGVYVEKARALKGYYLGEIDLSEFDIKEQQKKEKNIASQIRNILGEKEEKDYAQEMYEEDSADEETYGKDYAQEDDYSDLEDYSEEEEPEENYNRKLIYEENSDEDYAEEVNYKDNYTEKVNFENNYSDKEDYNEDSSEDSHEDYTVEVDFGDDYAVKEDNEENYTDKENYKEEDSHEDYTVEVDFEDNYAEEDSKEIYNGKVNSEEDYIESEESEENYLDSEKIQEDYTVKVKNEEKYAEEKFDEVKNESEAHEKELEIEEQSEIKASEILNYASEKIMEPILDTKTNVLKDETFAMEKNTAELEVEEEIYRLLREEDRIEEVVSENNEVKEVSKQSKETNESGKPEIFKMEPVDDANLFEEEDSELYRKLFEVGISLEDVFHNFYRMEQLNKQLVRCFERILYHKFKNVNIIITGDKQSGKTYLAKIISKLLNQLNGTISSRVAIIDANKLNDIDLLSKKEQLASCTLIVENAGKLNKESVKGLLELKNTYTYSAVILEGSKEGINQLLREHKELNEVFINRIHINKYNVDDYLGFAYSYLKNREYEIDVEAYAGIREILLKQMKENREYSLEAVFSVMHDIIQRAEERSTKQLLLIAQTGQYVDSDLMVIRKEDLIP